MASKYSCTACHSATQKIVGPSFKDIAAKYASDGSAADKLAAKIRGGSAGVWGAVPMPPNSQVSEADAKALATWILQTK